MTTTTKRASGKTIRPPIKRHGGKAYLAKRIVALMPDHRTYCEPFVGGGSVLLNKPKAEREFAGDLDRRLIAMWTALVDIPQMFIDSLKGVEYLESTFDWALKNIDSPLEIPAAVAYIVRNRFSRGGLGKTFAWSDRLRGGQPGDANAWDTIRKELPVIAERVRDMHFYRLPATTLIENVDSSDALHYLDPPYMHETRTATRAYEYEMTRNGHQELLDVARRCEGAVMLSGYDNSMYAEALADWSKVTWELPNHSGQGATKQRRVECLWINRPLPTEPTP